MTAAELEIVINILSVLLSAFVIIRAVPLLRIPQRQFTAASFLFAMVSLLLVYAYWLAYSMIRPDVRMPLAANMIGECAVFLLLSVMLESVFRGSHIPSWPHIICTLLFAAASIALWIAWSGEWIQDILGGIAYGYFLYVCARTLLRTDAFSRREWLALGVSCAVIVTAYVVWVFVPEHLVWVLNLIGYAATYTVTLFFLLKTFRALRRGRNADRQLALAVSAHAWCMGAMYMSSDWFYSASMLLCLLTLPMMLLAVRREAECA